MMALRTAKRSSIRALVVAVIAVTVIPVLAQRPDIPPQAIAAPALAYDALAPSAAVDLPTGTEFGQVASAALDSHGHLIVLNRGERAFFEFDAAGKFVRAFGEGLFVRAHGLYIDRDDFMWVTDVSAHVVMKLDSDGNVLMTLGTPGEAGEWNEATGSHAFDQPTDVAVGPDGSVFVTQGHGQGDPRVLKFDQDGRFLKSWGGRGTQPWQFAVAHSIVIDGDGLVYIADRENRRIQVFDLDGEFVKGWLYRGMACSLDLAPDGYLYMTTGFDAQIVKLDLNGVVLGVTGRPGEGTGEYGEAHDLVVNSASEIFVADVVNRRLQKLVPR
jgi:DNA-binding beta-propeller fold protein YncE